MTSGIKTLGYVVAGGVLVNVITRAMDAKAAQNKSAQQAGTDSYTGDMAGAVYDPLAYTSNPWMTQQDNMLRIQNIGTGWE